MSRSGTIMYEFEELQPRKGLSLFAYGEAEITYEWDAGDRDVGILGGYGYSVEDIYLAADKGNEKIKLEESDPLCKQIREKLMSYGYQGSIIGRIEEHDAW